MVNVGKYTSPMDPMGFFTDRIMKVHSSNLIWIDMAINESFKMMHLGKFRGGDVLRLTETILRHPHKPETHNLQWKEYSIWYPP